MFSFQYTVNNKLPLLAWFADVNIQEENVYLIAGKKVECHDDFFVTGVWDGEFIKSGFDESDVFFGTGAKINGDCVSFFTPSHALERICLYENDGHIYLSNSVPFIMSRCGLSLDSKNDQYEAIFCSILKGVNKYTRSIPLADGKTMNHYIVSEIRIKKNGETEICRRKKVRDFTSFDDYFGRLMNSMMLVKENSTSPQRSNSSFGLVSTLTSGYDSSTCAAVARKMGCETVVSLTDGEYDDDCGDMVAKELGYGKVIKKSKYSYRTKPGCIDAEYMSSGEAGKHQQFCVFEQEFAGNLVFMGTRGDYYWSKDSVANSDFEMVGFYVYETDISYTENALKNGYVLIPLATYGAVCGKSIQKVTLSEEMKPWTLGTSYDRPIPRRIVESSGVSRKSFGMKKRGGGFCYCYDTVKTAEHKMTEEGYRSFIGYLKGKDKIKKSPKRFMHRISYSASIVPTVVNVASRKLGGKNILKQKPPKLTNPGFGADLIYWSITVMKERYKTEMNGK